MKKTLILIGIIFLSSSASANCEASLKDLVGLSYEIGRLDGALITELSIIAPSQTPDLKELELRKNKILNEASESFLKACVNDTI